MNDNRLAENTYFEMFFFKKIKYGLLFNSVKTKQIRTLNL